MDLERGLNAALVETTPEFRVLQRRVLFPLGPELSITDGGDDFYDVEPGGQRFLMGRTTGTLNRGAGLEELITVTNFFEELRQVAPD